MWGAGKLEKRRMGRRGGGMGVRDEVRVEHIGNLFYLFYVGAALLLSIRDVTRSVHCTLQARRS